MRTRTVVTAVVVLCIGGFAFLTVYAVIDQGVTLGTLVSLGVLVLLTVGILGALGSQPPEE